MISLLQASRLGNGRWVVLQCGMRWMPSGTKGDCSVEIGCLFVETKCLAPRISESLCR